MENQDKMRLMKPRSARMVLAKGFRLYAESFRRLLKASWLTAVVYALSCGLLGTVTAIRLPEMTTTMIQMTANGETLTDDAARTYMVTVGAILLLLLLNIVTYSMAAGTLLNKLREHKETNSISMPQSWLKPSLQLVWRTVKGVLLTALVVLLPAILAGLLMVALEKMMPEAAANHATTMTGAAMLLAIIIILMELPMAYVLMKYVMEPANGFWKTLRPAYSRGLHHWAQIFTVLFISTLITTIIIAVMMLPAHILYIANEQAHAGLLIGDELGMPSYITPLTFFTFTLCSLLAFYVGLLNIIHTYYLYGNIEYRSQES